MLNILLGDAVAQKGQDEGNKKAKKKTSITWNSAFVAFALHSLSEKHLFIYLHNKEPHFHEISCQATIGRTPISTSSRFVCRL